MALWHLQAWVSIDASRLDLLGHSSVLFCAAGLEADSASGPAECFELSGAESTSSESWKVAPAASDACSGRHERVCIVNR